MRGFKTAHTLVAALGAVLAAVALAPDAAGAKADAPMRVAVLDFTNGSGDEYAALGKGLQAMLTTDLAAVEAFELVERARLNDIRGELKLSGSGMVDPKTAVRIGKLAGASHLVTGAYTVVGDTMRLDGRLVAMASGKVLLAADVAGSKDTFFELEKELVKKLIAATGVTMAPKERAAVGKVHTADFTAFRKFSEGIDLFDHARYEEARRALREASGIDEGFDLARLTLDQYEALVTKARARADAAHVAQEERARMAEDADSQRESAVVARLFQIAGGETRASAVDRQVALGVLVQIYTQNFHGWGFLARLEATGDAFALERRAESLIRSYWAAAEGLLGKVSPVSVYVGAPPPSVDKVDAFLVEAKERMTKSPNGFLSTGLEGTVHSLARKLQLDKHEELALFERLVEYGLKRPEGKSNGTRWMKELAEGFQGIGELERSTRWLTKLSASTEDPKLLDEVAELLAYNRDLAALTAKGPMQQIAREYLRNAISRPMRWPIKEAREHFAGEALTHKGAREFLRHRSWPNYATEYVIVGSEPVWVLSGDNRVSTSVRLDRYRTEGMDWYQEPREGRVEQPLLAVIGSSTRKAFEASFQLGFEMAPEVALAMSDYEKKRFGELGDQRPTVSFFFGLTDILTPTVRDAEKREDTTPRPMHGYGVVLAGGEAKLVGVRETGRGAGRPQGKELAFEELSSWKIRLDEKKTPVTVKVSGRNAEITIGGKRHQAQLPAEPDGFLGLGIDGAGVTTLRSLAVRAP
ncbi:MAG: CsgG/HfaB family protein [Myxococcota bacterium]